MFIFLFTAAERILTKDDLCLEGASLTVRKAIEEQDVHTDLNDSEQTYDSGKACDMIMYSCFSFVPFLVRFVLFHVNNAECTNFLDLIFATVFDWFEVETGNN